jgi:hypothetical protein
MAFVPVPVVISEPPPTIPSAPLPVTVMLPPVLLVVISPALFSVAPLRVKVMLRLEPSVTPEFTVNPPPMVVEKVPPNKLITLLLPARVRNCSEGIVIEKAPPLLVSVAVPSVGPVMVMPAAAVLVRLIGVAVEAVTTFPLERVIDGELTVNPLPVETVYAVPGENEMDAPTACALKFVDPLEPGLNVCVPPRVIALAPLTDVVIAVVPPPVSEIVPPLPPNSRPAGLEMLIFPLAKLDVIVPLLESDRVEIDRPEPLAVKSPPEIMLTEQPVQFENRLMPPPED